MTNGTARTAVGRDRLRDRSRRINVGNNRSVSEGVVASFRALTMRDMASSLGMTRLVQAAGPSEARCDRIPAAL